MGNDVIPGHDSGLQAEIGSYSAGVARSSSGSATRTPKRSAKGVTPVYSPATKKLLEMAETREDDEDDLFFKSICLTFKKFSPRLKRSVRVHLTQLMAQYEDQNDSGSSMGPQFPAEGHHSQQQVFVGSNDNVSGGSYLTMLG